MLIEPSSQKPLAAKQHNEHQANNDWRNRKRKINERNEQRFASEIELGDRPGRDQAKTHV